MKIIRISIVLIIFQSLLGCGGGSDSASGAGQGATNSASSLSLERLIVVIGDSIGTGFGASVAYPDLLQSLTGIPVVNVSKPGSNAEFGASRAADLIAQHRPMYLVMLLGTNNTGGGGGGVSGAVNSLQFAANVANEAGVVPIIGTIPPISRDAGENANASAISAGIRGISGARIAPINRSVSISDIEDGKHPNNRGQEIIAQLFAQQIF
ncbi:MAG: SGNH/GDSL hydrolase family protein [bacterium]